MGWRQSQTLPVSYGDVWRRVGILRARIDRLQGCKGFSFIEVMIVVVILAVLATLLIPRVMGRTKMPSGRRLKPKSPRWKAHCNSISSTMAMGRRPSKD